MILHYEFINYVFISLIVLATVESLLRFLTLHALNSESDCCTG